MITIRFDGFTMEAIGHAGYSEKGKDIVCAGASALFFAAAEYLKQMHEYGMLEGRPWLKLKPGEVRISCRPKEATAAEAEHVFRFLAIGCRQLAEGYPDNVSVVSAT